MFVPLSHVCPTMKYTNLADVLYQPLCEAGDCYICITFRHLREHKIGGRRKELLVTPYISIRQSFDQYMAVMESCIELLNIKSAIHLHKIQMMVRKATTNG